MLFDHVSRSTLAVIEGEHSLTYGELMERALSVSSYVEDHFTNQTAIGVRCGNRIEFAELVLGVVISGRDAVLIPDFIPDFVVEIMKAYVGFETVIGLGGALDPELGYDITGYYEAETPGTFVFMTSGTTGMPKLVKFPQGLLSSSYEDEASFLEMREGTRVYFPGPSLLAASMVFNFGATLVIHREPPTSEKIASVFNEYEVEYFFTSPSLLDRCIRDGVFDNDYPTLTHMSSTASRMSEATAKWCKDHSDRYTIFDTYTSSESGVLSFKKFGKPDSYLLGPGLEIELRDVEDGVGQVWFRGRDRMTGFYDDEGYMPNDEEWVTNGDYCRFVWGVGAGLEVVARANGKAKFHGFTVYTSVIEKALVQNNLAMDAMVTFRRGEPDDEIVAQVVSHYDEDKLRDALLAFVPRFCIPATIEYVDFIDRSAIEGGRMGNGSRNSV
jgi:acyl-coenzyme A synthetase/AMP-(fatty) acid ligase